MDKYLLYYEIKKNHKTVKVLCAETGISKSSFYRKLAGTTQFTLSDIKKIKKCLNLDSPVDIFFAN